MGRVVTGKVDFNSMFREGKIVITVGSTIDSTVRSITVTFDNDAKMRRLSVFSDWKPSTGTNSTK